MSYFSWHYLEVNLFLLKFWLNYLFAAWHFFSLKILLASLFSPWRRVAESKNEAGFSLEEFFNRLSFNLLSRLIGFLVRLFLIFWGLLASLTILFLAWFFLLGWQLAMPLSLPLYFLWRKRRQKPTALILKESGGDPSLIFKKILNLPFGRFVFERLGLQASRLILQGRSQPVNLDEAKLAHLSDLLYVLARDWPPFKKFLFEHQVKAEDVLAVGRWFEKLEADKAKKARFWEKENLLKGPGLGWNFCFGYTPQLDKYVTDLALPNPFFHQLVGREKEVSQIEEVLARSGQNNVLLIGEPGVGKKTIILGFAKKVNEGRIRSELAHKRVLNLDLNRVVAGQAPSQAKNQLLALLKEAEAAGNVILVIENIDKFTANQQSELDFTDVFAQVAGSYRLQLIGVTTLEAYFQKLAANDQLLKLFTKIEVAAPTAEEALNILMEKVPYFEAGHKAKISYQALRRIIQLSERLLTEIPFPEKAVDLLDETMSKYGSQRRLLKEEDIDKLVAERIKVPVSTMLENTEREKLKDLENKLHRRIVDQEMAIKALASALRRARLAVSRRNKPIGSFLFLGPTGVGKTETAKALSEIYFGSEKRLIRLDMSQYQQLSSLESLIGSPNSGMGLLIEKVKNQPFSVLLLDELEKADQRLLNIFLTILDEGYFQDFRGKRVSFLDLIIIATSNAAAEYIRERVKAGVDHEQLQTEVIEYIQREGWFLPEFLNRFDAIVVFKPLSNSEIRQVAQLQLQALAQRLAEKELALVIDEALIESVAEGGYSLEFGARPMQRFIADKIEDTIAKALLSETLKRGDKISVKWDEGKKEYGVETLQI